MPKVKKIPQRMCVGCHEMKPKKQLLRLVRTLDGVIDVDFTGKRAGRGAYICPEENCLKSAIKAKSLEKSFKAAISTEVYIKIEKELVKMKEQTPIPPHGRINA